MDELSNKSKYEYSSNFFFNWIARFDLDLDTGIYIFMHDQSIIYLESTHMSISKIYHNLFNGFGFIMSQIAYK